jgi:hypothetical protein
VGGALGAPIPSGRRVPTRCRYVSRLRSARRYQGQQTDHVSILSNNIVDVETGPTDHAFPPASHGTDSPICVLV